MIKLIDEILMKFRNCFSRYASFSWFVVIVIGLMVRHDKLGVTSVIRSLCLWPCYELLIGFFRSSGWELEILIRRWCQIVKEFAPLAKVNGSVVVIGDGVKQSKEGRKMPGVKRIHQESENSSKAEYIYGHLFGGVGVLAEIGAGKDFCIPLALMLQDGVKAILGWGENSERQASHVVEMIKLGHSIAQHFGNAYLLLDRLFLTVPALRALDDLNSTGKETVYMVTKAKSNCVAYQDPKPRTGKRGRPAKKGKAVKLFKYFESMRDNPQTSKVKLYGKNEHVKYCHVDLLWGQKLYRKLRFVFVEYNNQRSILVSTDLNLRPIDIIQLYGKRFSIENTFREMKQVVSAFGYRFWSKHMPKLKRFRKKDDPDPIEMVTDARARKRIRLTVKAFEGYVFCCTVATGILQMLSIRFSSEKDSLSVRYMRTKSRIALSEATIAEYLRQNIYLLLYKNPDLGITRIIRSKQIGKNNRHEKMEAS